MASEDDEPYKTRIQQMIFSKADAKYALMKGYSENIWFTKVLYVYAYFHCDFHVYVNVRNA